MKEAYATTTYEDRMREELSDLLERKDRLKEVLLDGILPREDRFLLQEQLESMVWYAAVLATRVARAELC